MEEPPARQLLALRQLLAPQQLLAPRQLLPRVGGVERLPLAALAVLRQGQVLPALQRRGRPRSHAPAAGCLGLNPSYKTSRVPSFGSLASDHATLQASKRRVTKRRSTADNPHINPRASSCDVEVCIEYEHTDQLGPSSPGGPGPRAPPPEAPPAQPGVWKFQVSLIFENGEGAVPSELRQLRGAGPHIESFMTVEGF